MCSYLCEIYNKPIFPLLNVLRLQFRNETSQGSPFLLPPNHKKNNKRIF